jgi:hemoglobin
MDSSFYIPPAGPPQISPPQVFEKVGMEPLYDMAWIQYQELAKSAIASMFPAGEEELRAASRRNAAFMCGILGGPKIYQQKFGPPQMRQRHLPFAIDENARQEWLRCFYTAFTQANRLGLDTDEQKALLLWINQFSAWMVNRK